MITEKRFEVITLNENGEETSLLSLRTELVAIAHARSMLYTFGTTKTLIKRDGEKYLGYVIGSNGRPETLIF